MTKAEIALQLTLSLIEKGLVHGDGVGHEAAADTVSDVFNRIYRALGSDDKSR